MKRIVLLTSLAALITVVLTLGAAGLVLAQNDPCTTADGLLTCTTAGASGTGDNTPGGGGGRTETSTCIDPAVCDTLQSSETSGGFGGLTANDGDPGGSGGHLERQTNNTTPRTSSGTFSGGDSDGDGGHCTRESVSFPGGGGGGITECTPNGDPTVFGTPR